MQGSLRTAGAIAAAALSLLVGFVLPASARQIIDLGSPDLFPAYGYGINGNGEIVGSYTANNGNDTKAFRWSSGAGFTDLGSLSGPSGNYSVAYAINTGGIVVGESVTPSGDRHAFRTGGNGVMEDLGTLGGTTSTAYAISDSGIIVGSAQNNLGNTEAFVYSNGVMSGIGTLDGDFSEARGINANGVVVGTASNGFENRAFLYSGGTMSDLLGQATVGNSSANAIAGNFVVGRFADGTDERAYLFDFATTTFTDLGTLGGQNSVARAVTASGVVVGQADNGIERRAFIYDRAGTGGMEDLTTLLNAQSSGWTVLTDVYGVTAQGYLVGSGIRNGETRVFAVLQPVPAPPAAVSLLIGVGTAVLGYGIRRLRRARNIRIFRRGQVPGHECPG